MMEQTLACCMYIHNISKILLSSHQRVMSIETENAICQRIEKQEYLIFSFYVLCRSSLGFIEFIGPNWHLDLDNLHLGYEVM